jgi:peptidoglycan/xylan/chitin deacetylase (PgdA/CDA1 family)
MTHIKGWKTSLNNYLTEIEETDTIIKTNSIENSNYNKIFRPPYGQIKKYQGSALIKKGYKIIMWSILSFDWDNSIKKEECLSYSLKTKSGDIVVFHDSLKASVNLKYVLPKFLKHYHQKEFQFKTL